MSFSVNELIRLFLDEKSIIDFRSDEVWIQHTLLYKKNEIIFSEGEKADAVFLVCKGKVVLVKRKEGHSTSIQKNHSYGVIDHFTSGEMLGLPAALSDNTHSTSAIAQSKVHALKVKREDLLLFLANHPTFHISVARKLSRKILHYERVLFKDV